MKSFLKNAVLSALFALLIGQPAFAQLVLSQSTASNGVTPLQLPYFEDDSGSNSVIQAQVQLNRFQQGRQLTISPTIRFNNPGHTYWININLTNNSTTQNWQLEFPSSPDYHVSPIKSLALYDPQNPEKPIQSWSNQSINPILYFSLQPGETINRFILVTTWPGVTSPVTPVLKTNIAAASDAVSLNRKLNFFWLVIGAVIGAGLVQLILTRQAVQGVLALNGFLVGVGVFALFHADQVEVLTNIHPVILPLLVNGTMGISACILLMSSSANQKTKSIFALIPLIANIGVMIAEYYYPDFFSAHLSLELLPVYLLSATGIVLAIITTILAIEDIMLFWVLPSWLLLTMLPWVDELPLIMPAIYVLLLSIMGVASVFGYWHSMDRETESLQRRLRTELRTTKEQYKEENEKWNKKMENERAILTELKQREQQRSKELEVAKKEADAANKAKSDFLAIISHEIRTPMNGIMGILQIIEQSRLDERQREYIEIIKNSGDTMIALLNDILDYSKIEKGAIELENIPFSLRKLVQSVAMLMHGRSEDKGLNIIVNIDASLPDSYISDVGRIRQVLLNLVSNAIKFTEKGSVTIKISRKSDDAFTLLFEVIDTGMGISEESQSKLFQAYAQADASITRRFGGTGLGLNICRMLINAMHGQIGVKSEVGKGSNFWFELPLEVTHQNEMETSKETVAEYKPAKSLYSLVIDDNDVNLKIVSSFLEMDGHQVVTASSGQRGLDLIDQDRFDVVFVDMIMPEMDGKAFMLKLRQNTHPLRANLPAIALTGLASAEEIDEMQSIGIRDIVVKPISQASLRQAIDRLIAQPDSYELKLPDIMATLSHLSDNEKAELRDALKDSPALPQEQAPSETKTSFDMPALNMSLLGELKSTLDADTLKDMFSDLIEKSKELTDAIEKDAASGDYKSLGQNGHNIYGMAGNFGLQLLADNARKIEHAVRDGDNEKAAALSRSSRLILDHTLEALDQWINA